MEEGGRWTRRLLLVDDHPRAREGLRELLEDVEPTLRVETAASASEALRRVGATPPDLVLLDYRMPGASATETIAELHRMAPRLPVIVLTGDPTAEVEREVLAAGAAACLGKAGNVFELIDEIDRQTRHRS